MQSLVSHALLEIYEGKILARKKMETTYERFLKSALVVPTATAQDIELQEHGVRGRSRIWGLLKGLSGEGK